jgi:hypothetical protein
MFCTGKSEIRWNCTCNFNNDSWYRVSVQWIKLRVSTHQIHRLDRLQVTLLLHQYILQLSSFHVMPLTRSIQFGNIFFYWNKPFITAQSIFIRFLFYNIGWHFYIYINEWTTTDYDHCNELVAYFFPRLAAKYQYQCMGRWLCPLFKWETLVLEMKSEIKWSSALSLSLQPQQSFKIYFIPISVTFSF